MKIMLDAGHGYETQGKRSPDGMREYEFNRIVAYYARALLERHKDVIVYFAHSDEKDTPLQERTNQANHLGVNCYISIHANAYGTSWSNVRGIETFVYTTKPQISASLAQKVQNHLISATGLHNRGVKTANFHVLRETKMPAILVECGFMTNTEDMKLLRSDAYRRVCAEAIVKGICEQFGLDQRIPSELYKIQVGAFKEKREADKMMEKLRKDGYKAYVMKD